MVSGNINEELEWKHEILVGDLLRPWALYVSEKERAVLVHDPADMREAFVYEFFWQMCENGLRQKEVERLAGELIEIHATGFIQNQTRRLVRQALLVHEIPTRFYAARRYVDAGVSFGIEVPNEVPTAAQSAASDIEHPALLGEAMFDQKFVLQLPKLFPIPANSFLRALRHAVFCMRYIAGKIIPSRVEKFLGSRISTHPFRRLDHCILPHSVYNRAGPELALLQNTLCNWMQIKSPNTCQPRDIWLLDAFKNTSKVGYMSQQGS